jgi:aldose 1-epimerase
VLSYTSPDGEESYPGTLRASVTYTLKPDNRLVLDYQATTDASTHVNLTQHTFFNLALAGRRDVLDHVLTINASAFTPTDNTSIPTGEIAAVTGTPFDFRTPSPIGARIQADNPQMRRVNGYDHNYVLDRGSEPGPVLAVHVLEPESGRTMDVYTDQPGLQLYTGNNLDGRAIGRGGLAYARYFGFCLETQHFPDSPNQPAFPSTLLRPGEEYRTRTVWAFGVSR